VPIAGAFVAAQYHDGNGQAQWHRVNTVEGGRYSISVPARPNSLIFGAANALAVVESGGGSNNDWNMQVVDGNATENQVDFRLRRRRQIMAGASVTFSVERDSSLCSDFSDGVNPATRCGNVFVAVAAAGTLTIEARSVTPGGAPPLVHTAYGLDHARYGTISLPVEPGRVYWIQFETPVGVAPQEYFVLTSMQANAR
jgi:hypothetical protein